MKYIIKGTFLWILVFLFSCNKFTVVDTPTQVGISTVTYYVVFTLNGPKVQSIVVGTPYTDPGAKAEENGQPVQYTTSGTVDNNTVGFYPITYSAVNKDGYSSSITRYVAVLAEAASMRRMDGVVPARWFDPCSSFVRRVRILRCRHSPLPVR